MRRRLWVVLVTLAFVAVLVVAVFPTRTLLAQRASLNRVEEQLEVLDEQNRRLEERARRLGDDAEIERLAREEYHLIRPGEESFVVIPDPAAEPLAPPADGGGASEDHPLRQAWDWLADRF
ncbi:MAG TPA: cell division protein FtsL [Acidimicrobiales bacterium]|nr:cell division protein FtsL [Acidimicrobiales bacterium]